MILGQVVGTVWATRKHPQLGAHKLMLVRPYFYYNPTHAAEQLVAVDLIDAGVGDDVVVCLGAPARWSLGGVNLPVDAAILGIVDRCQLQRGAFAPDGRLRFIGDRPPRQLEWL
jgi:ethanolamine utilization protein EutN